LLLHPASDNAHRLTTYVFAAFAPEFRHQLLVRYPALLNGLLDKAISSKQDFNEVSTQLANIPPLPLTRSSSLNYVCSSCHGHCQRQSPCLLLHSPFCSMSLKRRHRTQMQTP
jgi:hypothetical protein